MKQGEIWKVDLSPKDNTKDGLVYDKDGVSITKAGGFRDEIGNHGGPNRPCLIISSDTMRNPILVAPISSNHPGRESFRYLIKSKGKPKALKEGSKILFDQIRAVDVDRFDKKIGAMETLDNKQLMEVLSDIRRIFRRLGVDKKSAT